MPNRHGEIPIMEIKQLNCAACGADLETSIRSLPKPGPFDWENGKIKYSHRSYLGHRHCGFQDFTFVVDLVPVWHEIQEKEPQKEKENN